MSPSVTAGAVAVGLVGLAFAAEPPMAEPREAMAAPVSLRWYAWPLDGPVMRRFEEPLGPFAAGHRGIDIGAPTGSTVRAAEAGVVAFAGRVAGQLHVSIDHPDGIRTTYSWLSAVAVSRGYRVSRGERVGASGTGHPGSGSAHLHLGARVGEAYLDPLLLLEPRSLVGLVQLAPLEDERGRPP